MYNSSKSSPWLLVSRPVVRQMRAARRECIDKEHAVLLNIADCRREFDLIKSSYLGSWDEKLNTSSNSAESPWVYHPGSASNMHQYGVIDAYPSGGFQWYLPARKQSEASEILRQAIYGLKANNWLNSNTRAIIHEHVLVNTDINRYAYGRVLLEITPSGYMLNTFDVKYFRAHMFLNNIDYFSMFCLVALGILTVYLLFYSISQLHTKGLVILKIFWIVHTLLFVVLSLMVISMQIAQIFVLHDLRSDLVDGHIPKGLYVQQIALLDDIIMYMYGMLGFLVIIRVSSNLIPYYY